MTPVCETVAQEDIDRFMRYVDKLPNGCWFWTGCRSRGKGNRKWYGSFKYKGKTIRAHVFSNDFLAGRGPPPPGCDRDHTCVFSLCVNFDHIEVVTKEVNHQRRMERTAARKETDDRQRTSSTDDTSPPGVIEAAGDGAGRREPPSYEALS